MSRIFNGKLCTHRKLYLVSLVSVSKLHAWLPGYRCGFEVMQGVTVQHHIRAPDWEIAITYVKPWINPVMEMDCYFGHELAMALRNHPFTISGVQTCLCLWLYLLLCSTYRQENEHCWVGGWEGGCKQTFIGIKQWHPSSGFFLNKAWGGFACKKHALQIHIHYIQLEGLDVVSVLS